MADRTGVGALLEDAWRLLVQHPLQLLLPLVVLGLLTSGGGNAYVGGGFTPWWMLPVLVAAALVGVLIALLVLAVQVAAWLVTFEAARDALATGQAPDLGRAWASVRWHVTGGRLGPSVSKAWRLVEPRLGEAILAFLALVLLQVLAQILVSWLPVVGRPLSGAVGGAFGAAVAALLAVVVRRGERAS